MRTCFFHGLTMTLKSIKTARLSSRSMSVISLILMTSWLWSVPRAIARTQDNTDNMPLVMAQQPITSQNEIRPFRVEDAYRLGGGDRIRVDVFQLPQYSGEFDVLVGGVINLPVIGEVFIDNMTLEQATGAIAAQYSEILRQPTVSISLLDRRAIQIGVAGEVNRPGSYTLSASNAEFPTVTQILEEAGGIRLSADLSQVQIRRPGLRGDEIITVDLLHLLQVGSLGEDITLRDGDTVFIPANNSPDLQNLSELSTASFSGEETQGINIAVVGEVFRPGPHTVTGSAQTGEAGETGQAQNSGRPTVTRAIQVAGGIKPLADVRRIQVLRNTRSGTEQVIEIDLWQLLQAGDLQQDLALQEGDTIVVPTAEAPNPEESAQLASASFSPDSIRINIVGEVDRPGIVEVPPNTPLSRGILAAGGFNNRASRGTVELIRLNPNGTVTARTIPVNFEQGVDAEFNPSLQNDDVVIVRRSTAASVSDTLETVANPLGRFLTLFTVPFTLLRLFD